MILACLMALRTRTKPFKVEYYLFGEPVNKRLRNGKQTAWRTIRASRNTPEIRL